MNIRLVAITRDDLLSIDVALGVPFFNQVLKLSNLVKALLVEVGLLGIENAKKRALDLRDEAIAALVIFDTHADPLRELARYIVNRKK